MEDKIRQARDIVITIWAAFIASFSQYGYDIFKNQFDGNAGKELLAGGSVFILAFLLLAIADVLVRGAFAIFAPLRRLIYGARYIEGHWYDILYDEHSRRIREVSVTTIAYERGELVADGHLYNANGIEIGRWHSLYSKYDGHVFDFTYTRTVDHDTHTKAEGRCKYEFAKKKPYPMSFEGAFWDPATPVPVRLYGFRIFSKSDIKLLSSKNPTKIKDFIRKTDQIFREDRSDLFQHMSGKQH